MKDTIIRFTRRELIAVKLSMRICEVLGQVYDMRKFRDAYLKIDRECERLK